MALSTQQILNMTQDQVEALSDEELKAVVSTLRATAKKRWERMSEENIFSPAMSQFSKGVNTKEVIKNAVVPTIKGMDRVRLLNEYKRYRDFLNSRTSHLKESRQYVNNLQEQVEDITGTEFTFEELSEFYKLYDQAKETNVGHILYYRTIMDTVAEVYDDDKFHNKRPKTILKEIEKRLNDIYESQAEPSSIYPSEFLE